MSSSQISHGIRAVPSEQTRYRGTSNQLNAENYTVWAGRLKGVLEVNNVWDIVNEDRLRPSRPTAHILGSTDSVEADAARADTYDAYMADFRKAACLLVESISDPQLSSMAQLMSDPIMLWKKLQQKFARKSEMSKSSAQKALHCFTHSETETAKETIVIFQAIVVRCEQQDAPIYEHTLERALLDSPNERYKPLKRSWQHARDKQDLEELFAAMRDDDEEYQGEAAPPAGAAALADAFQIELQAEIQKAEILWAQKYGRDKSASGSGGGRPAAAYTMCYCCSNKGHFARDCSQAGTARCDYCKKNGHLEKACKQKRDDEAKGSGRDDSAEASFFHGYSAALVEVAADNSSTASASTGEALAAGQILSANSLSGIFLADSGASHHICHDRTLLCKIQDLLGAQFCLQDLEGRHSQGL